MVVKIWTNLESGFYEIVRESPTHHGATQPTFQ
uniref:Uncharacterized protein n=1 Tax=Ciona intestinalis TaxID=7719 RepID=H2XXG0_CIOIN